MTDFQAGFSEKDKFWNVTDFISQPNDDAAVRMKLCPGLPAIIPSTKGSEDVARLKSKDSKSTEEDRKSSSQWLREKVPYITETRFVIPRF